MRLQERVGFPEVGRPAAVVAIVSVERADAPRWLAGLCSRADSVPGDALRMQHLSGVVAGRRSRLGRSHRVSPKGVVTKLATMDLVQSARYHDRRDAHDR